MEWSKFWQLVRNSSDLITVAGGLAAVNGLLAYFGGIPLAYVLPAMLVTVAAGLSLYDRMRGTKPVETKLRLRFFGDHRDPQRVEVSNIWHWYSLRNIVIVTDANGNQHQGAITNIVVVFDEPTIVTQIVASSPDFQIPPHEFKNYGARHAILVVTGIVPAGELEIRVIN